METIDNREENKEFSRFNNLYSLYNSAHKLLDWEYFSQWYENYELYWLHYLPKSLDALDNLILVRDRGTKKIGALKITFKSLEEKSEIKKIYQERLNRQHKLIRDTGTNMFTPKFPYICERLLKDDEISVINKLDIKLVLPIIYNDMDIVWENFHRHYSEYDKYGKQFFIVEKETKFGVKDISDTLLPIEFDYINLIHPCFLLCSENQLWGLFNLNDSHVSIPVKYQKLTPLYSKRNLFICKKSENVGIIDWNNQLVIPIVYQDISAINDNLFLCAKSNKFGVINIHNKEILPFIYEFIVPLTNGFIVTINNKRGFFNFNGQELLSPNYFLIEFLDQNHLIVKKEIGDSRRLIYNLENQSFVEIPDYDLLRACHYDIMRVKKGDKQALIGVNGAILEDFTDDPMKILHTYWSIIDNIKKSPKT